MAQTLLFQTHTTFNPEYTRVPLKKWHIDLEVKLSMRRSLYNKYCYAQNFYYQNTLNQILQGVGCFAIEHKDISQYSDSKEHLKKYFNRREIPKRLLIILRVSITQILTPRFFFNPISLELLMDKHVHRHKKLLNRKKDEKNYNMTKLLLKKKLLTFRPILKDLNETKPTTVVFMEMLKPLKSPQKQFDLELEQSRVLSDKNEKKQIQEFDKMISRKASNISISTKYTSSKHSQMTKSIAQFNPQTSGRVNQPLKVELPLSPHLQTMYLSAKISPQNVSIKKPFLSPKHQLICTIYGNPKLQLRKVNKENIARARY